MASQVTANYAVLFNILDMDGDEEITIDEWATVLRKEVKIPHSEVNDAEMEAAFKSMDLDGDGIVLVRDQTNMGFCTHENQFSH